MSQDAVSRKVAAIAAYQTQVGGSADEYLYSPESARAFAEATGRLAHTNYAEAFRPRRIVPNPTTGRLFS